MVLIKTLKIRVSEGISVSQYILSEEWESFEKHVSEIRVKRIRVNQGVGVIGILIGIYT